MRPETINQSFFVLNKIVKYILISLGVFLVGFILWYLRSIVLYIVISGFVSLIGSPLVRFFTKVGIKGFKIPQNMAAGLTLLLFWTLIFIVFSIFIPQVANQINELSKINVYTVVDNLNEPIRNIEGFAEKYNLSSGDEFSIKRYLRDKLISIFDVTYISDFFGSFVGMLGDIFVAIFSISFISFFFLKEKGIAMNFTITLIPQKYIDSVQHIFASINKFLRRYFIGIIVEVLLVMILNTIGLTIIGLKFSNALVIALFTGVMNVIPYLGPVIGATVGIFLGMATHLNYNFYTELLPLIGLMALVFAIVQIIDNMVFQPLIYSSSVKAHPLEIFLVILIAGNTVGILGMVLAIPVYTILRVIAKEFFNNYKLVKKLTAKL